MNIAHFNSAQWLIAIVAAFCVGLSKSGFGGMGMIAVLLVAGIMPAQESTGFLLPMLIFADCFAVTAFRKHAQWSHIVRLIPPAFLGVVAAYAWMKWMKHIPDHVFKPLIGWLVLFMVVLQWLRSRNEDWMSHIPHTRGFGWTMGGACGITTMLANAAGPISTMYLLAMKLPKWEFVGTGAWFFLIVNVFKVPFSIDLKLINGLSVTTDLLLLPAIIAGIALGRFLLSRISQQVFENLLLAFTALAAVRLILP
jgi:uncharacterized membrane protein YfcA